VATFSALVNAQLHSGLISRRQVGEEGLAAKVSGAHGGHGELASPEDRDRSVGSCRGHRASGSPCGGAAEGHAGQARADGLACVGSPFTGQPISALGPVLAVKIDNLAPARPQTGLTEAELV
jgi:hypothetical protein